VGTDSAHARFFSHCEILANEIIRIASIDCVKFFERNANAAVRCAAHRQAMRLTLRNRERYKVFPVHALRALTQFNPF
jgi:hypothetical protein